MIGRPAFPEILLNAPQNAHLVFVPAEEEPLAHVDRELEGVHQAQRLPGVVRFVGDEQFGQKRDVLRRQDLQRPGEVGQKLLFLNFPIPVGRVSCHGLNI